MKHLKSGDAIPPINASRYTLFAFRFCPYCDRVRLVLNHHKIEHDVILIALSDKPDWFVQMSPSGKVPMLLNEGSKLTESDLIMRFVDELRGPDASLLSVCGLDTFTEALNLANTFSRSTYSILYKTSADDDAVNSFHAACDSINRAIKGEYFAGDELSLADFVLLPMVDRLEVIVAQLKGIDPAQVTEWNPTEAAACEWPQLASYVSRMRRLAVVASLRQPTRILAIFADSMRRGQPEPDIV